MRRMLPIVLLVIGSAALAGEPLRVMTYNTWVGFDRKATLAEATEWLESKDLDILALQELKGFSGERLQEAALGWGHGDAVIYKRKGGWPQGLTSRHPIELVEQIEPGSEAGLRGTLYCRTAGYHVFVVHFNPRNYHHRRLEAEAVVKRVKPLLAAGERVIVLGDFNAHSRADRHELESRKALLKGWRAKERSNKDYHAFGEGGQLDYSVMEMFFQAGLVDPAVPSPGTFPTRVLAPDDGDTAHAAKLQRIDFILIDPLTAGEGTRTESPRDAVLDRISDHYPVLLEVPSRPTAAKQE
jgi:endonuclease/exonuclease/phosphatase family metal-dependent hydrolase